MLTFTDSASQLNVFCQNSLASGVNGTQICVFHEAYDESFRCFLQSQNTRGLKTQIGFAVLSNLAHKALKRQLRNQKFVTFLIPTNFTNGASAGFVPFFCWAIGALSKWPFCGESHERLLAWTSKAIGLVLFARHVRDCVQQNANFKNSNSSLNLSQVRVDTISFPVFA